MQNLGNTFWGIIEKIAYVVVGTCFRMCKKELSDELFFAFMQFVKFGIVGVSNTVISYVLYAVSLLGIQKANLFINMDYLVAQGIAFVLSVLWSFYWNNKMVFVPKEGEKRSVIGTLIKTYVSYSFTGLFLNSILLIIWVQVFHLSEFLAPVINLLISVPVNFIINKFWAFK